MLRLSHFVYTLLLLVLMSSAALAGHQADYTMKVTMDPAGLASLASQFMPPGEEAPDMPDGKVAGFYGSLNGWIDINAIAEAARQLPDWTLVLIGNVETDIMPLHSLPNVMLRPAMPHHDLAQWSQHWDVSLLPFRKNRQIDASNPLKLREYLAAGRPVAATYRFKAIDDLQAPVATPAPGAGLANAILAATSMEEEVREFRQHLAGETWEARAETVSKLIDTIRKGSPSGT